MLSRNLFNFAKKFMSTEASSSLVLRSETVDKVCTLTLNRPKALNALNSQLMKELSDHLNCLKTDANVNCVVLTGGDPKTSKAFAAGADIKEMSGFTYADTQRAGGFLDSWNSVATFTKPIIAAVNGFALGGGCELAMMCDIIYASSNAVFAQPEINIGTIPGAGGTQRLTRAVGKSKAMEIVLTGDTFSAEDAMKMGLISRVFSKEDLMEETNKLAKKIASKSQLLSALCKNAVLKGYNLGLDDACNYEKQLFYATFATEDQKIGMNAFANKQKPEWKNK